MASSSSSNCSYGSTLASHYECPVCFEHALPPIHQCPQGHLICESCRAKLHYCPICRCSLNVDVRNLALERIAEDVLFPCTFNCGESVRWNEKKRHEDNCGMRRFLCPIPECHFEGPCDAIIVHFKVDHGLPNEFEERVECLIGGGGDVAFLKQLYSCMEEEMCYGQLMSCHNQHFLVILRRNDAYATALYGYEYQGTVVLIGPPEKAQDFIYRMEMENGDRRSIWEGPTQKVDISAAEAFVKGDCFFVHPKSAVLLGEKQADIISISVSISQKEAAESFVESEQNSPTDFEDPIEENE